MDEAAEVSHTPLTREQLDAMRTVGFIAGGLPSKPKVREWRDEASGRMKAVTDELGNTVTQHGRTERQDVHIRAPQVEIKANQKENRP